jgi:hypothetical protein
LVRQARQSPLVQSQSMAQPGTVIATHARGEPNATKRQEPATRSSPELTARSVDGPLQAMTSPSTWRRSCARADHRMTFGATRMRSYDARLEAAGEFIV